ncbi:unnamed protein product [Auanema sp. JU1783]|nr:unnamed protein product [Auanema sp. JU1783]
MFLLASSQGHLIRIFLLTSIFGYVESASHLVIEPSFLLINEDWEVGKELPIAICPQKARILSGNVGNVFSIRKLNETCSTLVLNIQLDADKEFNGGYGQSFALVLSGPRNARATLDIEVVDVNDNAPEFINTPSTLSISEDLKEDSVITKIRTRDVDTGVGGLARYSLDDDDQFYLDKKKCSNGECWTTLKLKKPLDYEKQSVHNLIITAEDGDPHVQNTNKATHQLAIHVLDVQDSPPVWKTDFSKPIIIEETMKIGDEIYKIQAVDGDEKNPNEIRYSVEPNDYVTIHETTGSIKLKKIPSPNTDIRLYVTAKENDSNAMSIKADIILETSFSKKETNQIKFCASDLTTTQVKEGSEQFEQALVVKFNQPVTPGILIIDGHSNIFKIGDNQNDPQTIEVLIANPKLIDYEKEKSLIFYVKSPFGRCKVQVDVLDENDNSPRFTDDTFLFYVTENQNSTVLGQIEAKDADSDKYLPITYSILGNHSHLFAINENGQLRSLMSIDRELNDKFDLTVRATDAGGRSTDCPVKIVVRDVNDNPPMFDKDSYRIEVEEEKSLKVRITASDADLGQNAEIVYSISKVPEAIPIDFSAGILFVGKIDRDTMDSDEINVLLTATDKGEPPLSSSVNLTIFVIDINDNYPVFTNSRYSIVLDANISPGGVIGGVKAEDGDATSPNNYISYKTSDSNFKITDNGEILYSGNGLLRKDSSLEFMITAVDGGSPSKNATSKVIINEHKAAMQSELIAELMGNETLNSTEIKWANSRMAGYTYEIIRATADGFKDQEVRKWLEIDEKSGIIHTVTSLTPDVVKQIRLYISMRKGKREVPVELIINVVDNDAPPSFRKDVYRGSVAENTSPGTRVLKVKAHGDSDNQYQYSLTIQYGPRDVLSIDNYGWIFLKKSLDFESFERILGIVTAVDELGNSASTNFSLQITDINDNRPIFKNGSVFTVHLPESTEVGTIIPLPYPLATDADSGINGELKYSLLGGDGHFEINATTSEIKLIWELDYENQRAHSLTLRCVDNPKSEQSNEVFASVTVVVEDINDNKPLLHNSDLQHLTVSEDAFPSTIVTVLSVTDADEGGRQIVRLDANHTHFKIDEENRLVVSNELKGFAGERICSSLIATDSGKPAQVVKYPYCITVYPATNNHHNPLIVFPKPNSIHYFDENLDYDELLRMKLLDEGDLHNISYRIDTSFKKDWEHFTINQTGSLKSKEVFDFEKKNVYELKVLACRAANCSSVHIFISVNDRNDNCPIFPKQDVRLSLVENDKSPLPRQVGRIPAALDADFHSDNTKVCYTTESPLFFFVDPTLPILYTNVSFDREQHKQHQITIVSFDCLLSCRDPHKPMNSTITGIIEVLDKNDNIPRFSERTYVATVIQGQVSAGSHLTSLSATDLDVEPDGLRYSIQGPVRTGTEAYLHHESPITVDPATGEVSANDVLKEPLYTFTASVIDGAGHEDTAIVTIYVVTYEQQAELLFDAPFDFIVHNEKDIIKLLSEVTSLTAVVDRCRQNSNFTMVLAHFLKKDGSFENVDTIIDVITSSNSSSKRELRSTYGLRETTSSTQTVLFLNPRTASIGVAAILCICLLLAICCWCRSRNDYSSKLHQISVHAAAHHASLGRPNAKGAPAYYLDGVIPILSSNGMSGRLVPPPPPLQSTEL